MTERNQQLVEDMAEDIWSYDRELRDKIINDAQFGEVYDGIVDLQDALGASLVEKVEAWNGPESMLIDAVCLRIKGWT